MSEASVHVGGTVVASYRGRSFPARVVKMSREAAQVVDNRGDVWTLLLTSLAARSPSRTEMGEG